MARGGQSVINGANIAGYREAAKGFHKEMPKFGSFASVCAGSQTAERLCTY